jgi:fluoroacetyl-CoA thioesterase
MLERFVRLCEIASPTGEERAVADAVLGELRALGVDVVEDGAAGPAGLAAAAASGGRGRPAARLRLATMEGVPSTRLPHRGPPMGRCDPGLKLARELEVHDAHTAAALGSGDVPVLGTPALLARAEGACVDAIKDDLEEGQTSVGTWAEIEHLSPTPVGQTVCAHATLIGHHGRRLEFNVLIDQDGETVAKVRHRRVLVDRERFLSKVAPAPTG